MNHHRILRGPARRLAGALAAATLCASLSAAAAAGSTAPAAVQGYARVGASLPVADFATAAAPDGLARATGYASLLAGVPVAPAGAAAEPAPVQAAYQVRSVGGLHYLAEAPRTRSVVDLTNASLPPASDTEVAARESATAPTRDRSDFIRVLVDGPRRDVLAVNAAVTDDTTARFDVGATQARLVFDAAVQQLAAAQLLGAEDTALDNVRLRRLMQGEQAAGKRPVTRVKEYFFEVPAMVGGIEVFGAATTVSVHRSGQLASIRSLGPSSVAPAGELVTRLLPAETLARRATAEHPGATVVPLGLRYPWKATSDLALAGRPREAFQVIPTAEVDGQKITGRAHYVFYSVEDMRVPPLVWPRPNPAATGDERK